MPWAVPDGNRESREMIRKEDDSVLWDDPDKTHKSKEVMRN